MAESFYPKAQREGFIVQPLDGELILHDGKVTHLLNVTAAAVWQKCDGHHSIADIARELALEETTVLYALQNLEQKKLLQSTVPLAGVFQPMTRREFLKKGALAAAAIPVVKTIRLPNPNVPISGACTCGGCTGQPCATTADCTLGDCFSGCCELV